MSLLPRIASRRPSAAAALFGFVAAVATAAWLTPPRLVQAAEADAVEAALEQSDAAAGEAAVDDLAAREARLAERFERLELLAERLAELSRSTQPRRAQVLRELIARSREQDLSGDFEEIVAALQNESFSSALERQGKVHGELSKLLELLLQEDRDSQIESDRKRIGKYLKELKRVIRMQRGVKGRTDGGDEADRLIEDQARIAKRAGQLGGQIDATEGTKEQADESPSGEGETEGGDSDADESNGENEAGDESGESGQRQDGSSGDEDASSSEGAPPQPGESPPSESQPGGGSPSSGKPQQNQPSQSGGQQGEPSQGAAEQSQGESQQQNQTPADRAVEQIRRAQQRMEQAQEKLEKSQREGAVEEQEQAIQELEQAKAELERILRQLREEELERTLVLLEARFRKMLEAQIEVYEETKKLDAAVSAPVHEREIAAAKLSRDEQQIVRDADRALILLREDGTSVAFPEAIEQARQDMQTIADRLTRLKTSLITQGLEEDVIASLEETLAAMQRALQDLREQQARGQQGQGQGQQPGEQPLVAKLAELRMIRALQARVHNRTLRYGALVQGEMALDVELREALDELAVRQQRIYQAAHDLDTDQNQ